MDEEKKAHGLPRTRGPGACHSDRSDGTARWASVHGQRPEVQAYKLLIRDSQPSEGHPKVSAIGPLETNRAIGHPAHEAGFHLILAAGVTPRAQSILVLGKRIIERRLLFFPRLFRRCRGLFGRRCGGRCGRGSRRLGGRFLRWRCRAGAPPGQRALLAFSRGSRLLRRFGRFLRRGRRGRCGRRGSGRCRLLSGSGGRSRFLCRGRCGRRRCRLYGRHSRFLRRGGRFLDWRSRSRCGRGRSRCGGLLSGRSRFLRRYSRGSCGRRRRRSGHGRWGRRRRRLRGWRGSGRFGGRLQLGWRRGRRQRGVLDGSRRGPRSVGFLWRRSWRRRWRRGHGRGHWGRRCDCRSRRRRGRRHARGLRGSGRCRGRCGSAGRVARNATRGHCTARRTTGHFLATCRHAANATRRPQRLGQHDGSAAQQLGGVAQDTSQLRPQQRLALPTRHLDAQADSVA